MLKNENVENITLEEWEKFYEKLFGGFEDLNEEDSYSDEEEIPEHLKTKQGYSKEGGFIVSDDDEDEDYNPDDEDDEDDDLEELSEYDSNENIDDTGEDEEEYAESCGAEEDDDEDDEDDDDDDEDEDEDDEDIAGSELSEEEYIHE